MEAQLVPLSLESLGSGGAMELFNLEVRRALENILDRNTDHRVVRRIAVELHIKPLDDKREQAAILIHVHSKLAAPKGLQSNVFLGYKDGQAVAVQYDPKQSDMFRDTEGVLPINRAAGAPGA